MYLHSDRTKFPEVREEIEQALRLVPLFSEEADRTMASHHYETLAKRLLDDGERGALFAEFLADELIKAVKNRRSSSRRLPQRLAELILTKYPTIILPKFASHIEEMDRADRWFFSHLLGTPFSFDEKREGPLFRLGDEVVLAACRTFPKNFAVLVAEVAPLFSSSTGGAKEWAVVGKRLLDEFGARKDVLNALSINISTGGWTGPTSSYLRSFLPPLEQAESHATRQVRSWAREKVKQLNAQIEQELRDEEEQSLRRG
jgi:hypothetical protein